jgi:putative membrane protein
MPRWIVRWLVATLTILMIPKLVSGVHVDSLSTAVAAAAVLGILNVLVKPVLILLTLPLTILTLGFFLLIINALVFQWAGALVAGFQVDSFGSALLAALIVSIVSWLLNASVVRKGGRRVIVVRRDTDRKTIDLDRDSDGEWH